MNFDDSDTEGFINNLSKYKAIDRLKLEEDIALDDLHNFVGFLKRKKYGTGPDGTFLQELRTWLSTLMNHHKIIGTLNRAHSSAIATCIPKGGE